MYANLQTQLSTGKLRFLIDERQAKLKMDSSRAKKFKDMTDEDRANYIVPFTQTSLLKDQLVNLEQKNDGVNIILDRTNKNIRKDKVSAMGYGLWYIKTEVDDVAMRRKQMTIDQMLKVGKSSGRKTSLSSRITFHGNRKYSSNMRGKKR